MIPRQSARRLAPVLLVFLVGACLGTWPASGDEITFLPGAAETPGQAGGRFSSTLTLFNPGNAAANLRIGMIPFSGKNRPPEITRTVEAGETQRIPAVLATLFGLDRDAGTLVATSTSPLVYSLSTQNVADPAGAYGLALLPVPEASLLSAGETGHAVWASQSADPATGFRTNVAVTLVDPSSAVTVSIYDASGALVGQTYVSSDVPAAWQGRLVDLIGGGALPLGRVEFSVVAGRATAYTVLNDNVTSDGIASQVEKAGTGPADRLLDGVAKTPGLGGAYWSTDVRLFNPGSVPLDVTIDALGFQATTTAIVQTVPPRGLLELSKILDRFGLPDGVAGALRFRSAGPLLVGARTLNSDPTGRRSGTFSSQQFVLDLPAGLLGAGTKGFFVGIDQSFATPGVRTNLALFGGSSGAEGRLVLRDPSGTQRATANFSRGPFEWGQLNVADWFQSAVALRSSGGTALEAITADSRIDVEVSAGSVDGYVSRVDNGSGDPITVPITLDPYSCGVESFAIDPFSASPSPLLQGQAATLSWDFRRNGALIDVTGQELSIDGAAPSPLPVSQRTQLLDFGSTGHHDVTLTAHDRCRPVSRFLDLTVCAPLSIGPNPLPSGLVGSPYSTTLISDGSAPFLWTVTGELPRGLTLDPATGILSGTPSQTGTFPLTLGVTDGNGCQGSLAVALRIASDRTCGHLSIAPSSIPNGVVGTVYPPVTFSASGTAGAVSWQVSSGVLPSGLSLSTAGVLSGTPLSAGAHSVIITVTDSKRCSADQTFHLTVCNPISLGPASIPSATATGFYSQALTQTGGTGTTGFALTSGSLPPGITLSPAGLLSGTPTVTGAFPFTVTATDSLGCTGSLAYTVTVVCPTITVAPASLPNATAATGYSQTFTATGGVGTRTFAVTAGALPAGLSLSAAGLLSGSPTVVGTFHFTITAKDENSCTGSQALTLVVACPTISVTPTALAAGTATVPYSQTMTASGGVGPYTFAVSAGTPPAGLTLAPGGVLSGTPSAVGDITFTVTATDAHACSGSATVTIRIACPAITVSPASLPGGVSGSSYGQSITASGGTAPYAFAVTSGTLPAGLTLAAGGLLSGTTTIAGTYSFVVTATDTYGCPGTQSYSVTVVCPTIVVNPSTLPGGTVGSSYSQTISAVGGTPSYSFAVTAGSLPTNLNLNPATGALTGTPTTPGLFTFTITATDADGCTGSRATSIRICPVITIDPPTLPGPLQGVPFTASVSASGSASAPYSYAVTTGTLPAGLSLDNATGAITGTPTTLGPYSVTITATDADGCTGSRTYSGRVCPVITVSPASLPNGVVGTAYSQTVSGSGSAATPITFAVSAGTLPTNLLLNGATGAISGSPTAAGTFPFTITATDANGCTASTAFTVEICVTPTITPIPAAVCASSAGNQGSGPAGVASWSWSISGGTITSATNIQTVTYTAGSGASVSLTLTTTTATGCSASTTLAVPINTAPATPSASSNGPVCAGSTLNLFATTVSGAIYSWTGPNGFTSSSQNPSIAAATTAASGTYSVTVTVGGCTSAAGTTTATVNAIPAAPTATNGGPICAGSTLNLFATTVSGATYSWTGPNGFASFSQNPSIAAATTAAAGTYSVTVTVGGCTSAAGTTTATVNAVPTLSPAAGALTAVLYNTTYANVATFSASPPGTYTYSISAAPFGLLFNTSTGVLSGTPNNTGIAASFTVSATNSSTGCFTTQTYTLTSRPVAGNDSYSNGVGNTQYVVALSCPSAVTTPNVCVVGSVLSNDSGPVSLSAGSPSVPTNGSVSLSSNGTFVYTPNVGFTGPSDSFTYTLTDGNGITNTATVTINLSGIVWYVNNTIGSTGDGRSHNPFKLLSDAQGPGVGKPQVNQTIFVHTGSGFTTGSLSLLAGQTLWGQGTAFSFGSLAIAAGAKPTLSGTVTLGGNGITVSSVDLSTAGSTGLTNSGTITGVTVKNSVTVTTTTGTAVLLNNAGGSFTFRSVSSNGATNGIFLTNPSGTFTVTGDGTLNGSGGTIQNTSGAGVRLENTSGNTATLSLTSMTITRGGNENVHARTSAGTMNLSFSRCTVSNATAGGSADGIHLDVGTTGNATLTADQSVFSLNTGDHISASLFGTGSLGVTITANTFTGDRGSTHGGTGLGQGVFVSSGTDLSFPAPNTFTSTGTVTYTISNNNFQGAVLDAIYVNADGTGGSFSGTIANNTIGTAGITDSGSAQGAGIALLESRAATHTATMTGNSIFQYNFAGIWVEGNTGSGTMNLTVKTNTIANPGAFSIAGLFADIGAVPAPPDTTRLCAVFGGSVPGDHNSITGSGGGVNPDFWLMNEQNDVVNLPGYPGGLTNTAAVASFIQGNNSVGATYQVDLLGGGSFTGSGTTCP